MQDVSSRVDPPHYEHAFVTERVKASVEKRVGFAQIRGYDLSKKLSIMKIPLYFLAGGLCRILYGVNLVLICQRG